MVRAFLAIDLPRDLKKKLYELKSLDQPEGLKIKWVEEPNFHITLKFFGNISEKLLEKIYKKSFQALQKQNSFRLSINKIGYFPEKGLPRVVWLGLNLKDNKLTEIYKILEKIYKKMKIIDNKEHFHPHITLFRIKRLDNKKIFDEYLKELVEKAKDLEGLDFLVKELIFFKSTLKPQGPVYEPLYKIELTYDI